MSYTVLARRYRSGTFDEVVGQSHVAQTLKRAIESGRVAHAYLFNGTRGVGKTSMARILAKALNCHAFDAATATPCGKCTSCISISRGDDIDVIEIDAASNTGVDNVRDIINNAQYRPAASRFKVYIIDEAHMLSKPAFNALLKTLEEPPSHVKFILATTEPEKLLPTIVSRCQRYDFRNIGTREIAGHLKEICKKEKISADEDALLLVAKAGAGSMRDSLSLLDRLLSIGEKKLTAEMIEQLLGLPKSQLIFDLAKAIGAGDVKSALGQADAMIAGGLSPDGLLVALIDHLRNLLILATCGVDSQLVEVPGLSIAEMHKQATQFDTATLAQDIAILEELRRQIRQSQAGRALLDATLVRLSLSEQFTSISQLLGQVAGAPAAPVQKKKPELAETPPPGRSASAARAEIAPPPIRPESDPEDDDDDLPRPGKVWNGPSLKDALKEQATKSAAVSAKTDNVEPVNADQFSDVWSRLLVKIAEHGPGLQATLSQARLCDIADGVAVIRFSPQGSTFVRMFEKNGKRDQVRDALTSVLGQAVGVRFEVDPQAEQPPAIAAPAAPPPRAPAADTPAPVREIPAQPAIRLTPELLEQLRADPIVRSVIEVFNANIVKVE